MKIPAWAEKAFDAQKPVAAAFSETAQPDAVALGRWEAYTNRFRQRWHELDPDRWSVQNVPPDDWTRFHILTAGLACAKKLVTGQTPAKTLQARSDMLDIERQISDLASSLASLFRLRAGIENDTGVASWRHQDFGLDPMDLWDAVELAFCPPHGSGSELPRAQVWDGLSKTLGQIRSTTLETPDWPELLEVLANHFECGTVPGDFPDITQMGHDTNKSQYSPWCRALINMLEGLNVLDCLTNAQLADLAEVALDAPPGVINAKQIGDLRRKMKELP